MKIYNSLTRKVEDFVPKNKELVQVYTCGPTVYSYAHIGNLRTYMAQDILVKTLKYLGYNVKRVMNITDVGHLTDDGDYGNDKMLKSAIKEHKSVLEIAQFYKDAFFEDFKSLNNEYPDVVENATDCIGDYIKIIKKLIDTGYAYLSHGNVYFDTSKLDNYYAFQNINKEDLLNGVREGVDVDENKKNATDFVLWFTKSKFEEQALKWNSPWGIGYPGWHIECSCIAMKNFGEYLDIHCGGIDNLFPHHTNEIAQSEGYLGHKWCNYWLHTAHLLDKNGKMSKSSGESMNLRAVLNKGYKPLEYRFFCLQSHYRNQLVFSYEALTNSAFAYNKLRNKVNSLSHTDSTEFNEEAQAFISKFKEALANDLNTAYAITLCYDVLKSNLTDTQKYYLIKDFDKVLSLDLCVPFESEQMEVPSEILELAEKRTQAKKDKNFAEADRFREEIFSKGYKVIDTPQGTKIEKL